MYDFHEKKLTDFLESFKEINVLINTVNDEDVFCVSTHPVRLATVHTVIKMTRH